MAISIPDSQWISSYLIDARRDPAEYWRSTMKGEPMPEAIEQLFVDRDPSSEAISAEYRFSKDFDTVPNAIIYHRAGPKKSKFSVRSSRRPEHGAKRGGERLVSVKSVVKVPEYNKAQRELIYRRYIAIPD
ncbi:hypothetical protein U1Q18_034886 [Sarracenia purpurea var. burkii]